jgi:hypothetical protein
MSADSSTKRFKVAAAEAALQPEALRRTDTLRVILQYVGRGDWLYAGAVSHRWCDLYKEVCLAAVQDRKLWRTSLPHVTRLPVFAHQLAPTVTLYKSAFQSLARLQWACNADLQLSTDALLPRQAGMFADQQTLLWARSHGLPWTEGICEGATAAGRLWLLDWLHREQGCPCSLRDVVRTALHHCVIDILNWLSDKDLVDCMELESVLRPEDEEYSWEWFDCDVNIDVYKSVSMLAWLRAQYSDLLTARAAKVLSDQAAAQNCFDSVRYLRRLYPAETRNCINSACASGNVEMVKYLVASGCPLSGTAPQERAATCSTADMLAYLREAGHGVWDQPTLDRLLVQAGKHGQLEPLRWLRAQGAQWPDAVCKAEYRQYHCWPLPTLQYAVQNGCPWGEWPFGVCAELKAQHFAEEVEWAHANGCVCGDVCPMRH